MWKNRKWYAAVLVTIFCLSAVWTVGGATDSTTEPTIDIKDIAIENGLVSVETVNNATVDTVVSFAVFKDNGADGLDRFYAADTTKLKSGETLIFQFQIPDVKRGVDSTGQYIVNLKNLEDEGVSKQFRYVTSGAISVFFDLLKTEAAKVTDPSKAYELLLPVVINSANRDVIYGIGYDYDGFIGMDAAVQQQTMNILYLADITTVTPELFPQIMNGAFGVAVYNTGRKEEGIKVSALKYNEKLMDEALIPNTVKTMQERYTSADTYSHDAIAGYGLAVIQKETAGSMADTLSVYNRETGLCGAGIEKLANLTPVLQHQAYEYMVLDLRNNGLTSNQALQELLDRAYASVITGGTTGSGSSSGGFGSSGAGGGAMIGKDYSSPVASGSAALGAGIGSGTTENKVETFTDLSKAHWAYESVKWLKARGIVSGTDTGAFEPDRQVTREEFAKMIVLASGILVNNQSADFADLTSGAWYVPYIGAATEAGIVGGVGDGHFGIGRNITRQDMVVMAKRALDTKAVQLTKVKDYTAFTDADTFADYAIDSVKVLFEAGIVNGKGENLFDPNGTATRAEAAKIIYEAFKEVAI